MDPLEATLLFANDAFYAAFGAGDFDAMDDLWAHAAPVSCIHPGGPVLIGRDLVVDSWRSILGGERTVDIVNLDAAPMIHGETGWVTCLERIGDNILAATNIFVHEDGAWKMTHHQAGPTSARPETEEPRPSQAH